MENKNMCKPVSQIDEFYLQMQLAGWISHVSPSGPVLCGIKSLTRKDQESLLQRWKVANALKTTQDMLDCLSVLVKYLVFDVEASCRELEISRKNCERLAQERDELLDKLKRREGGAE